MLLKALGPLEICHGQDSSTPSATKPRVVLALLLVNANRVVSTDALMDEVWDGDPPASGANTLQTYVYQLRKFLGGLQAPGGAGPRLVTAPGGYLLQVPDDMFDVAIFSKLADHGSRALDSGNPAEGASLLSGALGIWRGDALSGVALGSRLSSYVTYLHERRLRAIERYNEARLAQGHAPALVASLKDLAHRYPDHEAFQLQVMLALSRSGRRAEALGHFRAVRARLAEELGLDPSRQLELMHEAILSARSDVIEEGRPVLETSLPRPAQLLPDCAGFHGYGDLLGRARTVLEVSPEDRPAPPVVRVSGPPGAGRASFATHLAHLVKGSYPDGQFFQRVDRTGTSATLRGFLAAAGIPASHIPEGESAQAALFRSWSADRRALVVLHNVTNEHELENLLPAGPGCGSVITSVTALPRAPGSEDIRLAGLDQESALGLLRDYAGPDRMSPSASTVVSRCDRMPGLLAEIGSLLANNPGCDMDYVSTLLREDSWTLWRLCGGHDRLVERLGETIGGLDEAEMMVLKHLGAASRPPTLPDLVRAFGATTLVMASAIDRLIRRGLVVERPATFVSALPAEPGYEVPQLIKQYLRFSARQPRPGAAAARVKPTLSCG
jgi:DNA-binding SARP family transcriptional activator